MVSEKYSNPLKETQVHLVCSLMLEAWPMCPHGSERKGYASNEYNQQKYTEETLVPNNNGQHLEISLCDNWYSSWRSFYFLTKEQSYLVEFSFLPSGSKLKYGKLWSKSFEFLESVTSVFRYY